MSFAKARENAGFTQADAAKALGVSAAAVCQWEKGKTSPKFPMLRSIAKLYGCSIDVLAAGSDENVDETLNEEVVAG